MFFLLMHNKLYILPLFFFFCFVFYVFFNQIMIVVLFIKKPIIHFFLTKQNINIKNHTVAHFEENIRYISFNQLLIYFTLVKSISDKIRIWRIRWHFQSITLKYKYLLIEITHVSQFILSFRSFKKQQTSYWYNWI